MNAITMSKQLWVPQDSTGSRCASQACTLVKLAVDLETAHVRLIVHKVKPLGFVKALLDRMDVPTLQSGHVTVLP